MLKIPKYYFFQIPYRSLEFFDSVKFTIFGIRNLECYQVSAKIIMEGSNCAFGNFEDIVP